MASLIEFAGIIGALMVSVLTGLLMAWLWFETFFRVVAPVRRFATPRQRTHRSRRPARNRFQERAPFALTAHLTGRPRTGTGRSPEDLHPEEAATTMSRCDSALWACLPRDFGARAIIPHRHDARRIRAGFSPYQAYQAACRNPCRPRTLLARCVPPRAGLDWRGARLGQPATPSSAAPGASHLDRPKPLDALGRQYRFDPSRHLLGAAECRLSPQPPAALSRASADRRQREFRGLLVGGAGRAW